MYVAISYHLLDLPLYLRTGGWPAHLDWGELGFACHGQADNTTTEFHHVSNSIGGCRAFRFLKRAVFRFADKLELKMKFETVRVTGRTAGLKP